MGTSAGDQAASSANGEQTAFLPPVAADPGATSKAALDTRPEILVGAAFAGGLLLAKLLGRARGR